MFPQQGQSQQQHMAAQQPSMMQQVLQRVNNEMAAERERSAFLQFGQFLTGAAQPAEQPFGQHRQPPPPNKDKCFYCNEHNAGHIARNCPKKAKDEEAAAQKRAEEILREREREQAVVVKQEPGALMPSGCMRPFATPVSAEQHFGNNMNFGNTSMQLTPYSTPQPGQQQMQLQQQTAAQAAAQQQEQMAQAQHDIVAKVQQSVQVSMDAMNATLQQSISDSFSTVRTELENGKASQMLMRSELNSLVTKYEGVVGAVSEVKKSNAALKAAVDATVQSALKRVAVLEAQPPQKRGRDNAGRVTIDIAGTPATPKGRRANKKAEPAAETDPEDETIEDLAHRIVADGAAGALPQRLRKSPPRAAKAKKKGKRGDESD